MLAIDGAEPEELRKMMELELDNQEDHGERLSQVFEAAGGFAPTVGIIGAVLGLIQVMQHLEDITEVGKGSRLPLWRPFTALDGQHPFSSLGRKAENQVSRRAGAARDEAGRRHLHPRRHESAHA